MTGLTSDAGVQLVPEPGRVVARLFLPGDSTPGSVSRTQAVLERTLSLTEEEVSEAANSVLLRFQSRHSHFAETLRENAQTVRPADAERLSADLEILIGAVFTAEYAVEAAALCNPSVVGHPDQSGLEDGQLRVVVSLRSIGEGHLSSIQFCEAIIGPGPAWEFLDRERPLALAEMTQGQWSREHLARALEYVGRSDELARSVTQALPESFGSNDIELAVRKLPAALLNQADARDQLQGIRVVAGSAYQARFSPESTLSQRVLLPAADEENRGVEDARFVEFTDAAGLSDYRATYTAYNGQAIATRLLRTTDFRTFSVARLTGPPADTKGMALFPRPVAGRLLALGRGDGEAISLTSSADGLNWGPERLLHSPGQSWEIVQGGNCGSPLETDSGWLVLTHGVGPLRTYSIGAILLDLNDPSRVIGALKVPLIEPTETEADGYVPNVVYTCGGLIHDQRLWIPYGLADQRIRVAQVSLPQLLQQMRDVTSG